VEIPRGSFEKTTFMLAEQGSRTIPIRAIDRLANRANPRICRDSKDNRASIVASGA
jgi:hypothetical protein